jgi:hypothetical protein
MKVGGRNGIVDKNKSKRTIEKSRKIRHVEYLAIGHHIYHHL